MIDYDQRTKDPEMKNGSEGESRMSEENATQIQLNKTIFSNDTARIEKEKRAFLHPTNRIKKKVISGKGEGTGQNWYRQGDHKVMVTARNFHAVSRSRCRE